jgi:hypothetical protein
MGTLGPRARLSWLENSDFAGFAAAKPRQKFFSNHLPIQTAEAAAEGGDGDGADFQAVDFGR